MVHYAARCAYNHMYATLELANLAGVVLTTINSQYVKSGNVLRVAFKRFSNLHCKLAGRRERHHLYASIVEV